MSWLRRHLNFNFFLVVFVIAAASTRLINGQTTTGRALLIGFDIAAFLFLLRMLPLFVAFSVADLRARAKLSGGDHHGLLMIGGVVIAIVMVALLSELEDSQSITILLSAGTLVLAWIFANTLFLLHYAQIYYSQYDHKDHRGLVFPGNDPEPDAWDFAYFTFTLAIIFSVSDVIITSRRIRRIAMFHGMLAFVFNIFVIGISVGLIGNAFQDRLPDAHAATIKFSER
jgi:uncharacterized membrane protein